MMKYSSYKGLLAVLLLTVALSPLAALEVDSGRVRLILHEGIGRFSLYTRSTSADYIPLFVDQDPRTSGLSLVVNDKLYKLGETSEFAEKTAKTTNPLTARFEWTSRVLKVVQEFTPVSSGGKIDAEGVRMSIRITNRSPSRLSVGMRLCLDTYLGEDNLSHFSSDRHKEIRRELSVTDSDMIGYWLSPSADSPQNIGLLCVTSGSDITSPDKIVFANWKRISEASWGYETSTNRNFNLMPYSINDSAVCMYYEPVDLLAQESREIVLVLANVTLTDYGQVAEATSAAVAVSERPVEQVPADTLQELRTRLSSDVGTLEQILEELNSLIGLTDQLLAAPEQLSDEQLRLMEEILSVIKDKSERYSGGR
ncbi:MAG: hypothetical protein JSV89_07115 [Spirochaetaceae bacterium]|nr:MAG: hypothetical protein JSV89_07115 [Spirochaetaceae bacterium]